eukprot:327119-Pyramimonas_sp.AAC.2
MVRFEGVPRWWQRIRQRGASEIAEHGRILAPPRPKPTGPKTAGPWRTPIVHFEVDTVPARHPRDAAAPCFPKPAPQSPPAMPPPTLKPKPKHGPRPPAAPPPDHLRNTGPAPPNADMMGALRQAAAAPAAHEVAQEVVRTLQQQQQPQQQPQVIAMPCTPPWHAWPQAAMPQATLQPLPFPRRAARSGGSVAATAAAADRSRAAAAATAPGSAPHSREGGAHLPSRAAVYGSHPSSRARRSRSPSTMR